MPDTPPAELPNPCTTDSIMLEAWMCVPDGEETKWVRHFHPLSEATSARVGAVSGCGGDCSKKVNMVLELAKQNWKPAEIERVLKAL